MKESDGTDLPTQIIDWLYDDLNSSIITKVRLYQWSGTQIWGWRQGASGVCDKKIKQSFWVRHIK